MTGQRVTSAAYAVADEEPSDCGIAVIGMGCRFPGGVNSPADHRELLLRDAPVVLKRLADVLRDGDRVLAVIRGTTIISDGRSHGVMQPGFDSQVALLSDACAAAVVRGPTVDNVEARDVGTLVGDPVEARAIGVVMGKERPAGAAYLTGSAKTSIGHTESTAGIVGLIKAVLCLINSQILPSEKAGNHG